jgi:hypothetical protein
MESADDHKRPMEGEDDNSRPVARATKKIKKETETTLSPPVSEDSTTASAATKKKSRDIEETSGLATVQRKLSDEKALTLRMSFWLSQDHDWFSEELVRTQCLAERLQFFITDNASLRERVTYLITENASLRAERVKYPEKNDQDFEGEGGLD